jgi:Protein of unknown function (DUF4058)
MTPIRAIKNQYRGINAHLHSYWQSEGGWDSFHANHIADLMRLMTAQLLPMGYVADIQQSLQIRRYDEPAGKPESDVTIYDTDPIRASRSYSQSSANPAALAIADIMTVRQEFAEYAAVGIYEYVPSKPELGEPVAWVELLSPSNKPGGQDAAYYRDKRLKLLHSGIVFVEIDYLHESPPTFDRISRYSGKNSDLDSHPYRIVVIDPRPIFDEGKAYPHHFDVDEPIPSINIPLNANDTLPFDFEAAYNKTFEETFYGARLVDYSQLPLNFDRYRRDDQEKTLARVLAILKAVKSGVDLEQNAPLPTEAIDFDEAMQQIEAWK